MYYKLLNYRTPVFFLACLMMVACGGSTSTASVETETQETESPAPESEPAAEPAPAASADGVVEISLSGNDLMQYDKSELEVPSGSTVKLTLSHSGQLAKAAMGHNFVLLKQGTALEEFATTAMQAADNDYLPADMMDQVIAHTSMIGGGESTSVEFEAPAAGEYEYLCTFPGHFAMMRGTFVVK
ncbi:MAG: azurin [Bacteroidota bacterium]